MKISLRAVPQFSTATLLKGCQMTMTSAGQNIASQLAKATGVPEEHVIKILSALKFDELVDRARAATAVIKNPDYKNLSAWTEEEQKQIELAANPEKLKLENVRIMVSTGPGSLSRGAGHIA